MRNNLAPLIKLPKEEEEKFAKFIQKKRKELILPPKETTTIVRLAHESKITALLSAGKVSETIILLRKFSYYEFLKQESVFCGEILKEIANIFDAPKNILKNIGHQLFLLNSDNETHFFNKLNELFGQYSGYISPYTYLLSLSNTQSRRSRAGKEFEGIIYSLYEYFHFPYESQATIGKKAFSELGLGKVVDSILPGIQAFNEFRNQTIVGTMKTTLRERWQEVVEEIQRSTLPNIYLLTVDDDLSANKVEQMGRHNIVLVVLDTIKKQQHLADKRNVINFEHYFTKEIPRILAYWQH